MGSLVDVIAKSSDKYVEKIREAKGKIQERRKARQFTRAQENLSCLVEQVYVADGGQRKQASKVWKELGYKECKLSDFGIEGADVKVAGESTCKIRFMVFSRRDSSFRGWWDREAWTSERPKYVVAIRGTKLKCRKDVLDDFRHFTETLHTSGEYDVLLRMTLKVFERCRGETVCVTGHSLGAAFGLLVARKLVLKGRHVQAHLFNPPFLTLGSAAGKLAREIDHTLPEQVREMFQAICQALCDMVKAVLPQPRNQIVQEYYQLRTWRPHLYVNEHDIICNEYIEYFKRNVPQSRSSLAGLSLGLAKSNHMIPSAVLHTNSRHLPGKAIESAHVSHKNNQWFKHPLEGYSVQEYGLLEDESASA